MANVGSSNGSNHLLAKQGITTFTLCMLIAFTLLGLTSIFSRESCARSQADCVKLAVPGKDKYVISIPTGVFGSVVGAFSGALFTFGAFNSLEVLKLIREPRPRLVASFEPEDNSPGSRPDFSCLIVDSDPHFVEAGSSSEEEVGSFIHVGKASYLRIKVLNKGSVACKNVRAYLTQIEEKDSSNSNSPWSRLRSYKESLALLWAYEGRKDYFISGHGIDLPSQATSFADVLVSYDRSFTPKLGSAHSAISQEAGPHEVWFLKLKTKRQPINHVRLLEIRKDDDREWKLTVEVYGDQSPPGKVVLYMRHRPNDMFLEVRAEEITPKGMTLPRLLLHDDFAGGFTRPGVNVQNIYAQF